MKIYSLFATGLMLIGASCSHNSAADSRTTDADSGQAIFDAEGRTVRPPREVLDLVDAMLKADAPRFASAVSYPLARPYPLRDVTDSVKMAIYFPVMIDDSLRTVLRHAKAEEWSQNGWRGWTLADGRYLWVDEKLYELNYVSGAERDMLSTLVTEEINSLAPDMRKGWVPVLCLHGVDTGDLFRVDSRTDADAGVDDAYRLAVYHRGANLHGRPSLSMRGRLDEEGSAGSRTYNFRGRDGSRARYVCDDAGDGEPLHIVIISAHGDSVSQRVERAYWRDFLHVHPDSAKSR